MELLSALEYIMAAFSGLSVETELGGVLRVTASSPCADGYIYIYIYIYMSEFLATDPEARVRFPALPEKK
jgi:hypothetical protein